MMNIVNGGEHADNNVIFKNSWLCLLVLQTFKEAFRMGAEIFHTLKAVLKKKA